MPFPLGILVMSVSLPLVFLGAIVSTLVIPRYLDRFRFLIFLFRCAPSLSVLDAYAHVRHVVI